MEYYGHNDFRAYLSHHGIKGMHWGVRRFQPYGKGGYTPKNPGKSVDKANSSQKKVYHTVKKEVGLTTTNSGSYISTEQTNLAKTKQIKKAFNELSSARDKVKDASKLAVEFNTLPDKERDRYIRMASDAAWKNNGNLTGDEDREYWFNAYKYEDLDQGRTGSFAFFCKERGSTYEAERKKHTEARKEYRKECKTVSRKLLGKYADAPLATYKKYDGKKIVQTASDAVEEALSSLTSDDMFERKYYIPG